MISYRDFSPACRPERNCLCLGAVDDGLTDEGTLTFHVYFIQRQCEPIARGFEFFGIKRAYPHVEILNAFKYAE